MKELKEIIATMEVDYAKFKKGNAAAGTRARKGAQKAKQLLQDLRVEIQEEKNSRSK